MKYNLKIIWPILFVLFAFMAISTVETGILCSPYYQKTQTFSISNNIPQSSITITPPVINFSNTNDLCNIIKSISHNLPIPKNEIIFWTNSAGDEKFGAKTIDGHAVIFFTKIWQ